MPFKWLDNIYNLLQYILVAPSQLVIIKANVVIIPVIFNIAYMSRFGEKSSLLDSIRDFR